MALTTEPGVHAGTGASDVLVVNSASLVVRRCTNRRPQEWCRGRTHRIVRRTRTVLASRFDLDARTPRAAHRPRVAARPCRGIRPAASADGPVRRSARATSGRVTRRVSELAMAGRSGIRRGHCRWSRDARSRAGMGARNRRRSCDGGARGSGRRACSRSRRMHPDLDLSKVAIRGWSFGGYLAALAVLRRPDVFHVAVAGAPGIDWSLYDTYYTERYLGVDTSAPSYAISSLTYRRPHAVPAADDRARPRRRQRGRGAQPSTVHRAPCRWSTAHRAPPVWRDPHGSRRRTSRRTWSRSRCSSSAVHSG